MSDVVLRRWEVADAPWYADATHDAAIQRFTNEGEVTADRVRLAISVLREVEGRFAIADAETGAPLGNAGWKRDASSTSAEAYYWVAADARGRGVATAALTLLLDAAREAGIATVRLVIDRDNVASRRTAARAGFVLIGPGETRNGSVETVVYERGS